MNTDASSIKSPERKTGRPRRQDSYEKVSFTISTDLLRQVDQRAQKWGMNRSGAVARIVQSQISDATSDGEYEKMQDILKQINEILATRLTG